MAAVVVRMAAVGRGKAYGMGGGPPLPPYKGKRSAKRMTMQQLSAKYPAGMGAKNATKPLQRNGLQAKYPRSKGLTGLRIGAFDPPGYMPGSRPFGVVVLVKV